jgi:hypothetical protein
MHTIAGRKAAAVGLRENTAVTQRAWTAKERGSAKFLPNFMLPKSGKIFISKTGFLTCRNTELKDAE